MTDDSDLMTIGEFSARSRLSVRMLRHYDEHGVLVPAQVDPLTGYRRYAAAQLATAADVRRLRDVGFPVSAIASVLASRGTPGWIGALNSRRTELTADLAAARERITLIDSLIDGTTMSIVVSRNTFPAMRVVALRGTVPTYSDEGRLWSQFMPELAAQGITTQGPCGVIEHDSEFRESDVDESVWLPVGPDVRAAPPLTILDLPAREAVVARVVGPYSLIGEAHARIEEFLAAHGLAAAESTDQDVAAKPFNVYLTDPNSVAACEAVTDVCVPIA